jgi:hypothetical protein
MSISHKKDSSMAVYAVICIVVVITLGSVIGYLMNFQNLFEYWTGNLGSVELPWVLSLIGIFIPVVGVFTGWYF